jgi:Ran-binding protein 3
LFSEWTVTLLDYACIVDTSQEPYPTGSTAQPSASTKKNRLAPAKEVPEPDSSPVIGKGAALAPDVDIGDSNAVSATEEGGAMDESTAPTEGQTVGEVRRQVEKMTYEEGQTGDAVAVDKELRRAASAGGGQSQESKTENDNEEEWEEIDKTEVDEAKASEREGKELKRKALDRSESSFVKDDEAMAKRQKETPSVRCRPSCLAKCI